jgi:hypothetical protein
MIFSGGLDTPYQAETAFRLDHSFLKFVPLNILAQVNVLR